MLENNVAAWIIDEKNTAETAVLQFHTSNCQSPLKQCVTGVPCLRSSRQPENILEEFVRTAYRHMQQSEFAPKWEICGCVCAMLPFSACVRLVTTRIGREFSWLTGRSPRPTTNGIFRLGAFFQSITSYSKNLLKIRILVIFSFWTPST